MNTVKVYIDAEDTIYAPALEAVMVNATRWNGWLVPVVTEQAFRDFIAASKADDPNGTYDVRGIMVTDEGLIYSTGDHDYDDMWPMVGETSDGTPVYALAGWCWIYATDGES